MWTNLCFNPCFGGNQKSNAMEQWSPAEPFPVSILVLVEIRNQILLAAGSPVMIFSQFQSLFWWKSEIKWIQTGSSRDGKDTVSILVLVEIRNQMERETGGCVKMSEFQSLFWWKSEIKFSSPLQSSSACVHCFNPCFGGNQKSNIAQIYRSSKHILVSILVLVEIRNQINITRYLRSLIP